MRISWSGDKDLINALQKKSQTDWENVRNKSLVEMRDRAVKERNPLRGGTPVDTGELRLSAGVNSRAGEMGYTKEYGPHVEFGRRLANGGYVGGQHFLRNNLRIQTPIYEKDMKDAMEDD